MQRCQSKSNIQANNNTIIRKCSLKNLNIYDSGNEHAKGSSMRAMRGPV